ncbi:MAG: primosomal protein N', partial [Gammaproteobacteria bacterium]
MTEQTILRVAVPAPLRQALDYLPPPAPGPVAVPGMRVVVPLGRRKLVGIVLEVVAGSRLPEARLKPAIALPDDEPLLPPDVLELCQFAARYYHAPPGEALVGTLPASLRNPSHRGPRAIEQRWEATPESLALPADALARAPRQARALVFLQSNGPSSVSACRSAGFETATLRALAARGLAHCRDGPSAPPPPEASSSAALALNPEQERALAAL